MSRFASLFLFAFGVLAVVACFGDNGLDNDPIDFGEAPAGYDDDDDETAGSTDRSWANVTKPSATANSSSVAASTSPTS